MAIAGPLKPTTSIGVFEWFCVPSPSCPFRFEPQHFTVPLSVTMQLWPAPDERLLIDVVRFGTLTGVRRLMFVPSASWPRELAPQHHAPVEVLTTQTNLSPPVLIATMSCGRPGIVAGVFESSSIPSLSKSMYVSPQHLTSPLCRSAQLENSPPTIALTPDVSPET